MPSADSTGPARDAFPKGRMALLVVLLAIAVPRGNPVHSLAVHALFAIAYGTVELAVTRVRALASPGAFVVLFGALLGALVIVDVLVLRRAARARGGRGGLAAVRLAGASQIAALATFAAWMGACAIRHVEVALAAAGALVLAAERPRRRAAFGLAAALVLTRPALGPWLATALLAGAAGWAGWRRAAWRDVDRCVRWTALGAATGGILGFVIGMARPADEDLSRRWPPQSVYDLAPDPSGRALAFTTKGKLPPGLLDRATGALTLGPLSDTTAYERIAWIPGSTQAAISGVAGITLVDLGTRAPVRDVASMQTIDVEVIGPRRIAYAEEGSPAVHLVDLDTGAEETRKVPWGPYALEYVAARDALFMSAWLGEPRVVRMGIADGSYREVFNGWGSTDVCALPARGEIAVARPAYADVVILDDVTLERRRTLASDPLVREIECDPERELIFTASYFDGRVRAWDAVRGKMLDVVRVGGFVRALRYDARQRVLFAGSRDGVFELPVTGDAGIGSAFARRAHSPGR
ncbi:MAG: hypothetical protein U0610_18310 [bacterium]